MSVIAQAGAKGRQLQKFGGSSLADVKCYLRVAGIMAEYSQPDDMMVVSAAGSTTNQLINWLKLSQTDRLSAHQVQQTLRRYQCDLISGLLPAEEADSLISAFVSDLERLAALLDSGINDAVYAEVVGHGEVWSARQIDAVLKTQGAAAFEGAVIAYEPVWAIGTGKSATPAQAQAVHKFIRDHIAKVDANIAEQVIIQYGGSVNASNAAELFAQPDIDGALVGGASLKADAFAVIVKAAEAAKQA